MSEGGGEVGGKRMDRFTRRGGGRVKKEREGELAVLASTQS